MLSNVGHRSASSALIATSKLDLKLEKAKLAPKPIVKVGLRLPRRLSRRRSRVILCPTNPGQSERAHTPSLAFFHLSKPHNDTWRLVTSSTVTPCAGSSTVGGPRYVSDARLGAQPSLSCLEVISLSATSASFVPTTQVWYVYICYAVWPAQNMTNLRRSDTNLQSNTGVDPLSALPKTCHNVLYVCSYHHY